MSPLILLPMSSFTLPAGAVIRVECAWCSGVMVEGSALTPVSHGLCKPCAVRLEHEEAA